MKKKSTRGRRPGHLGKAHQDIPQLATAGITGEAAYWRQLGAANTGNYRGDVPRAAFLLGKLAGEYQDFLKMDRRTLEMNRRKSEIPLPYLPRGESFTPGEKKQFLEEGQDVIWILNFLGWHDAFSLFGMFIRAAAGLDETFFKELARFVGNSKNMNVPLTAGAEPDDRALVCLARAYWHEGNVIHADGLKHIAALTPEKQAKLPPLYRLALLLEPVFKHLPGKRPPLTINQIAEYIRVFGDGYVPMTERTLRKKAKSYGIPTPPQGRPRKSTN